MTESEPITLVIPAYNEADGIRDVVEEILASIEDQGRHEVTELVVVDDGSSDETAALVERLGATDGRIKLVRHETNRGFGAAVRTGLGAASGRYALMVPADGEWDPKELAGFCAAAARGARLAIGERDVRASDYTALRRLASAGFSLVIRVLFGVPLRDLTWVQMYDRERVDWQTPDSQTATYPVQIVLLDVSRNPLGMEEIERLPSRMRARGHGESKVWRPRAALRVAVDLLSFWWRFKVSKRSAQR